MAMQNQELKRVAREQIELYDAMTRSIWGDHMTLGMTAAALGGFGIGLLFSDGWGRRYLGALCYALAAMAQLYAAMMPKTGAERGTERTTERAAERSRTARAKAA